MTTEKKLRRLLRRAEIFILSEWWTFILSTVGCVIYSIGVVGFTLPYQFPDTGMTGIAVVLKYTMGISPAVTTLAGNLILLLWGGRELSKRFVAWTVYNVLMISFLLEALNAFTFPMIQDMFLVALAGGIIKGLGVGMVFRAGVCAGGLDIVIAVMRNKLGIEVGKYSFYVNLLIYLGSAGIVGIERTLYGLASAYVLGEVIDRLLSSFDKRRLIFIVTTDTQVVTSYISGALDRGSTVLYGEGGYSGEPRNTIMSLLTPRQVMELKKYMARKHPRSFMVITDASEVLGNGFKRWKNV